MYHGIIIDQEFTDQSFSNTFKIFAQKQDGDWGIYGIEIEGFKLQEVIKSIQLNMKNDSPWYAHLYNDHQLIVIFKNKVFEITPQKTSWQPAIDYGKELNIPAKQLDFQPNKFQEENNYFSDNEINLNLININDKEILRNLIKEYEKELLNIENPEEYKYLNSYWGKEDRFPYFINVDNKIAGFILVNGHTLINKDGKNIAEFYIKKEFRNKGIGKLAAFKVFDKFKGNWETRQIKENISAQNFWRKVVSEYTKNNFQEIFLNNKDWCGSVQFFTN